MELEKEALKLTKMLRGRTVDVIWRHRKKEIGIRFTDGTRLFVDQTPEGLDYSVTYDNYPARDSTRETKSKKPARGQKSRRALAK